MNVQAQMDSGGHFVDILAARALGANRIYLDLFFWEGNGGCELNHKCYIVPMTKSLAR
jgi:hypothetical protein